MNYELQKDYPSFSFFCLHCRIKSVRKDCKRKKNKDLCMLVNCSVIHITTIF